MRHTGKYPINQLTMDRGGHRALAASDDGTIKVLDLDNFTQMTELRGHDGAIQCIAAAPSESRPYWSEPTSTRGATVTP